MKARYGVRRNILNVWLVFDKKEARTVATCVSRHAARKQAKELNEIHNRERTQVQAVA